MNVRILNKRELVSKLNEKAVKKEVNKGFEFDVYYMNDSYIIDWAYISDNKLSNLVTQPYKHYMITSVIKTNFISNIDFINYINEHLVNIVKKRFDDKGMEFNPPPFSLDSKRRRLNSYIYEFFKAIDNTIKDGHDRFKINRYLRWSYKRFYDLYRLMQVMDIDDANFKLFKDIIVYISKNINVVWNNLELSNNDEIEIANIPYIKDFYKVIIDLYNQIDKDELYKLLKYDYKGESNE